MSYGPDDFQRDTNVSRETLDSLRIYADLLKKWTVKINLISKNTIDDIWYRHFLDSQQIVAHAPSVPEKWVDIGTGAGFPGLVIAIVLKNAWPDTEFVFIESDQRKAAFLMNVARETGANARVIAERIELSEPQDAQLLSARALAPISDLLDFASRHTSEDANLLLLKGARAEDELDAARENWRFKCAEFASKTDPTGVILRIGELERAQLSASPRT
jgi:16S rRNA (guanine527-N7)-methyltransferase